MLDRWVGRFRCREQRKDFAEEIGAWSATSVEDVSVCSSDAARSFLLASTFCALWDGFPGLSHDTSFQPTCLADLSDHVRPSS